MNLYLIAAALIGGFIVYGAIKTAHRRLHHHGIHAGLWRWFTGQPWNGRAVTDAGWFRPATRALTRTGHASRFSHLPRWKRTCWRTGCTLAPAAALYGYITDRAVTELAALLGAIAATLYLVWRTYRAVRRHQHRRTWLTPIHMALARDVGWAIADRPEKWIEVERDRSKATLALPQGFNASSHQQDQIGSAVAGKLGLEAPEVRWRLAGPRPTLEITAAQPPPQHVKFADITSAIAAAKPDEFVFGLGRKGAPVTASLSGDSPHIALSMASGAGKSTVARLLLSQHLNRGGIGVVLDPKLISLQWARGLPNVAYAGTPAEIHRVLMWLEHELDRRNAVALASADVDGIVHGNVGPPVLVVAEELNVGMNRLRAYWRTAKEPGEPNKSPAIEAMESLLFAGRQARMHVLAIAQMLSVRASAGGEARENMAARILARYSANAWKMLAPEHVMPPSSRVPGRVQIVTDKVNETQTAWQTPRQARDYSLAGMVTACPAGMPCVTAPEPRPELADRPSDLCAVTPDPSGVTPALEGAVTLREAKDAGIWKGSLGALRMHRHRTEGFPEPVGMRDGAHVYDVAALAAWAEGRSE